jgi:hypothetical protein
MRYILTHWHLCVRLCLGYIQVISIGANDHLTMYLGAVNMTEVIKCLYKTSDKTKTNGTLLVALTNCTMSWDIVLFSLGAISPLKWDSDTEQKYLN